MIIHYTKNAEEKFFVLQEHGCQILKEDITSIIATPVGVEKRKEYTYVRGAVPPEEGLWEVIYKKEDSIVSVMTFYPVKSKEDEV